MAVRIKWMLHDEVITTGDVDVLIEQFLKEEDPREQYFFRKDKRVAKNKLLRR